jgi:glycogen phosphorylase
MTKINPKVAYFSAEIGISPSLHTYSGGLGVLAGDHIKAATDQEIPLVAITLMYKQGYFTQRMDDVGMQKEYYSDFDPDPLLTRHPEKVKLTLRKRPVYIQAWEHSVKGLNGNKNSVFFLDTDLPENHPEDRKITLRLYSGDKDHRILQEAILGFGGIRMLEKLGFSDIETYHMNEGHCSFLTLELLKKFKYDEDEVRKHCVFTTHTPVPAGHDHFGLERVEKLLGHLTPKDIKLPSLVLSSRVHMTELGLHFSREANGVSKLHGVVAREQFPLSKIGHITNGVYHKYWMGKMFKELYDRHFPDWRQNPYRLMDIDKISDEELMHAHQGQKSFLLDYANSQTQRALSNDVLTIGFARRAASYKRAWLIFKDMERLQSIAHKKIQFIFAGKAHPMDDHGKAILQEIIQNSEKLRGFVKVVFLENYNMWLGKLITSGVDVWLNTPLRPNEASGTSGMKAAINGIPNLSVVDGWWAEGVDEGKNGWAVGNPDFPDDDSDAEHLYQLLEEKVIPAYYGKNGEWMQMMRASIKAGIHFTAYRMVKEYNERYYKA